MLHKFEVEFESPADEVSWLDILHIIISSPLFKRVEGSMCAVKPIKKKE